MKFKVFKTGEETTPPRLPSRPFGYAFCPMPEETVIFDSEDVPPFVFEMTDRFGRSLYRIERKTDSTDFSEE